MQNETMKRAYIIHGWGGHPGEGWFPWLKKELEKEKWNVSIPAMPDADHPRIETWVPFLAQQVGKPDKDTMLIGHSIGCQTILRYLATLPSDTKVGKVILVAGWVHLTPKTTAEEENETIARPWLDTPLDWKKMLVHTKKYTAIFSDNDPFVPLEDAKIFEKELHAKIVIEKKKGHLSGEHDVLKLPSLLKIIKEK